MPTPPAFAVDVALALRQRLLQAADALLPPWAAMMSRTFGIPRMYVLRALVELEVPAALAGGPLALDELATRVGADADTLHRVLRMAELDGIVKRGRRGRYALTRSGAYLDPAADASLDPWVRYMTLDSTREAFAALPETLRTGRPGFRVTKETTVWDWFAAHPDEEALFARAMRSITAFDSAEAAAVSSWPQSGTLCDVAGGTGQLLTAVLERRPQLHGILLDVPGVIEAARERLAGVERLEFATGDFFESIDVEADVFSLKNILHDWDDETCVRILRTVAGSMRPGDRVIVIEQRQERDEPHPFATPTDIQMLTQTDGGRERSVEELQALLRGAGLEPGNVERAGIGVFVEGRQAG